MVPAWEPICEREGCSQDAKRVHHWNYERVAKKQIGMEPEASEENDLIALCGECHASLHAEKKSSGKWILPAQDRDDEENTIIYL